MLIFVLMHIRLSNINFENSRRSVKKLNAGFSFYSGLNGANEVCFFFFYRLYYFVPLTTFNIYLNKT